MAGKRSICGKHSFSGGDIQETTASKKRKQGKKVTFNDHVEVLYLAQKKPFVKRREIETLNVYTITPFLDASFKQLRKKTE